MSASEVSVIYKFMVIALVIMLQIPLVTIITKVKVHGRLSGFN